ncbi:WbqC-like protein family [Burkholderiaceae bacterium]
MKKVAILQSNYIPWKGYFDIIASVDEFILYDDAQFTKNDWRNRNMIKTPQGAQWLTIPVGQDIDRRIRDVDLKNSKWQDKHWKTLESNYRRASHFSEIAEMISPMYLQREHRNLSTLNREFIKVVCDFLGINTKISNSWDYDLKPGRSERLVDLCGQVGATEYISGPAAKGYLEESLFSEIGIKVVWFDYSEYPQYRQLWGEFTHTVSILDLLFNCGNNTPSYMRHVKP